MPAIPERTRQRDRRRRAAVRPVNRSIARRAAAFVDGRVMAIHRWRRADLRPIGNQAAAIPVPVAGCVQNRDHDAECRRYESWENGGWGTGIGGWGVVVEPSDSLWLFL